MEISIVIPVYNGAGTIGLLVDKLFKNLSDYRLEIILVNDSSKDNSHEVCIGIFKKYKNSVVYLSLAKNFGEHNAVLAGLNHASGDYTVIIDDDFQNPPEEIRKLIDTAVSGQYDVAYAYYEEKFHSRFRNLGSSFNNLVASYLLNKPKDLYLSSFKCINRFTAQEIIKYKGPFPYIDGLILRATRNIGKVMVRHDERRQGRSGYTFRKLVRLWMNMFVNFSVYPLRISTIFGLILSGFGGLSIIYLIVDKLLHPEIQAGATSILVSILIFAGIQLIMLGLIGEYIGRQFLTTNQTPQYVIHDIYIDKKKGANL